MNKKEEGMDRSNTKKKRKKKKEEKKKKRKQKQNKQKNITANTSAICQHAAPTTDQLTHF